jgi:hypothetical protein
MEIIRQIDIIKKLGLTYEKIILQIEKAILN